MAKLFIKEEKNELVISPVKLNKKHLFVLLTESSLKKGWDNKYDKKWDTILI